jgi:hypothetical protein
MRFVGKGIEDGLKMEQEIYRVSIGGCFREIGRPVIYSVSRRQSFLISIYVLLELSNFIRNIPGLIPCILLWKEKVLYFAVKKEKLGEMDRTTWRLETGEKPPDLLGDGRKRSRS